MTKKVFLLCALCIFAKLLTAQVVDSTEIKKQALLHKLDSLKSVEVLKESSVSVVKEEKESNILHHSPTKATLLSTFIPGTGQIYNRQWWKTPIVYAGLGAVTYFAIRNYNGLTKFKQEYYDRVNGPGPQLSDYISYSDASIYNLYNAYKSNFQLSIIVGCAFYALQIVDAYVYGHLFSFDMSDDLSFNWVPVWYQNTLGFAVNLTF